MLKLKSRYCVSKIKLKAGAAPQVEDLKTKRCQFLLNDDAQEDLPLVIRETDLNLDESFDVTWVIKLQLKIKQEALIVLCRCDIQLLSH